MAKPQRKTVLVIDDDKMVQRYIEEFFKRLKFVFYAASDGYEGLKFALSSKPDLIFLDIMMPRFDGFKTLQVLKSNDLTKNIPVVVMTAYSDRINVVSACKLGAAAVITKPLTEEIFFEKLKQIFGEKFVRSVIPRDPKETENPFGVKEDEYNEVVRGMVEEFLKYYSAEVEDLERAVHEKNVDVIRRITHSLRGTGGSFGYGGAAALAVRLNELVHTSPIDWEEAEEVLIMLKNKLQR
ncbi:MAG TPA: response regulator [Candidatus Acidoferrales bacterium]|nr:response regulator [Candidatus Acidoferrales bacterium]